MCTGITHLVLSVIASFTASGLSVSVSSISTRTGTAPTLSTASKLATKVKLGIITSSPYPTPSVASAVVSAAVPLQTSCACLEPNLLLIASSSSFAFHLPFRAPSNPYRISMPVSSTSFTSFLSSSPNISYPGISF